jgi:transposase
MRPRGRGRARIPNRRSYHGLPEYQNRRRIGPPERLQRPQERQSVKRRLLVDTLGLLLSVYLGPAHVQDRAGAKCLLAGLKALSPRLKKVWADGAYAGEKLAGWLEERCGWELEIAERSADTEGFTVLAHRWIVERTLSWLMRNRRLSKDYVSGRCRLARRSSRWL